MFLYYYSAVLREFWERKMEENKNSKNKTHSQTLEERAHDQPASVRAGPPKKKDI